MKFIWKQERYIVILSRRSSRGKYLADTQTMPILEEKRPARYLNPARIIYSLLIATHRINSPWC